MAQIWRKYGANILYLLLPTSQKNSPQRTQKEIFYKKFLSVQNGCFLSIVRNHNFICTCYSQSLKIFL